MNNISKKRLEKQNNSLLVGNILTQMFMDVEFGVLSKQCKNYGICRIEQKNNFELNDCNVKLRRKSGATSIVSICSNGELEIAFPKSNITSKTAVNFFENQVFIVEEDYLYSFKTNGSRRSPSSVKIKKGNYPIVETLGFYIVKF